MTGVVTLGSRCVRGPDWQWGDQDGGVGHVGTVVQLGNSGHSDCPENTVKLIWDSGATQNYRTGYSNRHDLLLLDNGPSGVVHTNCHCSNCGAAPLCGIRWSCSQCQATHLCSSCYMSGAHDPRHSFIRYSTQHDPGVTVGQRAGLMLTETWGSFPGATVMRGPNWRFDNQDGGVGSRGFIKEVHDWSGGANTIPTARSVVSVVWPTKEDNMYSRGHKGMVHVQCLVPARGGKVYMEHLPVLGQQQEAPKKRFLIGQHVMVNVDLETLKQLQVGNGGFNPAMMEVVGRRGRVHRITEKGLVRVQYPGHPLLDHRWAINPAALRVIQGYNVGDEVKVSRDRQKVEKYQNPSALESVMGLKGTITLIHSDTSFVIDFGEGKVATLHPGCFEAPREQDDRATVNLKMVKAAAAGDLAAVESFLTGSHGGPQPEAFVVIPDLTAISTSLHSAAAKGHLQVLVTILKFRPGLVNERQSDKTALQVAAHEGHCLVADWLLQLGADHTLGDSQGDTALHYAAIGGKPDAVLTLVNKGLEVNIVNKAHRTALHIAVINRREDLARALLKVGADVNIQDVVGDTPFHLSLVQGDHKMIDLLLEGANLLTCNSRGHNALHIAAVKGDNVAVNKILKKDRGMVNIVTREGHSALHLASGTNVLFTLVKFPQTDVNIVDVQGRTVLHQVSALLEVSKVKMLVEVGARPGVQDMHGNTPAHLALLEGVSADLGLYSNQIEEVLERPSLDRLTDLDLSPLELAQLSIVCYLLRLQGPGADSLTNLQGQSVLDLVEDIRARRLVQEIVAPRFVQQEPEHEYAEIVEVEEPALDGAAANLPECRICSEVVPLVTFRPCGHQVICLECSSRVKKCLECGVKVEIELPEEEPGAVSEHRLRALEGTVKDLKRQVEDSQCPICMERKKEVVFGCGHPICFKCSEDMDICHMCRMPVEQRITLY